MTLVSSIFSYIIYIILILVKNLNMETNINPNDLEKYWIERQKINQSYVEKRQNLLKQLGELEVEHQTSITKLDDKFGKVFQRLIKQLQNKFKMRYFSINDKKITKKERIKDIMNETEKQDKKMKILFNDLDTEIDKNNNINDEDK